MFHAKNENEKVVLRFLEAISTGDLAQLQPFFTQDFVWQPMFTGAGVKEERGSQIIQKIFRPIFEIFEPDSLNIQVNLVISDGDTVACELINRGKLKDGRSYNDHCCWIISFRAGNMIRIREYLDSYYVSELMKSNDT